MMLPRPDVNNHLLHYLNVCHYFKMLLKTSAKKKIKIKTWSNFKEDTVKLPVPNIGNNLFHCLNVCQYLKMLLKTSAKKKI